jgi:hypothetical protein
MARTIAVVALTLALGSCSSLSSSLDQFTQPNPAILTINSAPPGAEVRLSTGGTCHTPCMLPVSAAGDFTVTYTLEGYLSQTISMRSIPTVKSAKRQSQQPPAAAPAAPATPPLLPWPGLGR